MEPIRDEITKGSHDYSPIQRQIIEVIHKEFDARVRISAVPKNLREMDLSVYFVDMRETVSFLVYGSEVEPDREDDCSLKIKAMIEEVLGENPFPPLKKVKIGAIYCHMKTGERYRLLFESKIGATGSIFLNYQCVDKTDDTIWARPKDEFMDGRFQLEKG